MMLKNVPTRSADRRGRRATAALAALAVTSLALAGCAGSGGDDAQTTVRFLSWDSPTVMKPLVDAFEAEHPDIKMELSNVADVGQYQATLQPQLLAGTAPDVFILGSKAEQVGGGYVLDLTDQDFVERLSPANIQYAAYQDKVYGVSTASWGGGFVYNADILAEVGITGPADFPTSWDAYLDLLAQLKDAGHSPLLESNTVGVATSLCALLGIENAAVGGDLDQQVFDGSLTWEDRWTEPLAQWSRLFEEDLETRDVVGLAQDVVMQEFTQGNVAMIGIGSWAVGQLNDLEPDFDMVFVPVPGAEEGSSYLCGAASPAVAVNANSSVQEEALEWVEWLTTPEAAELYNEQTGSITTTAGFTPVVDPALEGIIDSVQAGDIYLPIVNWPQYADALDAESTILLQRLIRGEIEPSAVGAGMDAKLAELQG